MMCAVNHGAHTDNMWRARNMRAPNCCYAWELARCRLEDQPCLLQGHERVEFAPPSLIRSNRGGARTHGIGRHVDVVGGPGGTRRGDVAWDRG